MRNRYPGKCLRCGNHVAANKGYFEKNNKRINEDLHYGKLDKWSVRCMNCVRKGHTKFSLEEIVLE